MTCQECGSTRRHYKSCSKHPSKRQDPAVTGPVTGSDKGTVKIPDEFKKQVYKARNFAEISKHLGQAIKNIRRGSQGLPIDEDIFSGLIKVQDPRERARLTGQQIYHQTCLRLIEAQGPECRVFGLMADLLDTYSITKDGDQWTHAVDIIKARGSPPSTLVQTNIPGAPGPQVPKKRSLIQKLTGRGKET